MKEPNPNSLIWKLLYSLQFVYKKNHTFYYFYFHRSIYTSQWSSRLIFQNSKMVSNLIAKRLYHNLYGVHIIVRLVDHLLCHAPRLCRFWVVQLPVVLQWNRVPTKITELWYRWMGEASLSQQTTVSVPVMGCWWIWRSAGNPPYLHCQNWVIRVGLVAVLSVLYFYPIQ